jgi:two-component system response regulator (stage 0 sporulation protein F)
VTTRVLIVEDDVDLREILELALGEEGYAVAAAGNGLEAIVSLIFGDRPDALLLNLHMPVLSGADVLDVLRVDPAWARLPVILMTGAPLPPELARRADAVLPKPFEIETLTETIDVLVSRGAAPPPSPTPPPCAAGL